jgi:hypothetical protein
VPEIKVVPAFPNRFATVPGTQHCKERQEERSAVYHGAAVVVPEFFRDVIYSISGAGQVRDATLPYGTLSDEEIPVCPCDSQFFSLAQIHRICATRTGNSRGRRRSMIP